MGLGECGVAAVVGSLHHVTFDHHCPKNNRDCPTSLAFAQALLEEENKELREASLL